MLLVPRHLLSALVACVVILHSDIRFHLPSGPQSQIWSLFRGDKENSLQSPGLPRSSESSGFRKQLLTHAPAKMHFGIRVYVHIGEECGDRSSFQLQKNVTLNLHMKTSYYKTIPRFIYFPRRKFFSWKVK